VALSKIFWSRATRVPTVWAGAGRPGKKSEDRDALASVFRTIDTTKGTCGFSGFTKFEGVAHVRGSLLSRLRGGQLSLNPEIATALLEMVDAVRHMLGEIQSTGQDGDGDYAALKATLTRLEQSVAMELEISRRRLPRENSARKRRPPRLPALAAERGFWVRQMLASRCRVVANFRLRREGDRGTV
jgi:chemotaxis protein histidine kinase CheA